MLRPTLLLSFLVACALQEAPVIEQEKLVLWVEDAMSESLACTERQEHEQALEAWRSGYGYFEEQIEPALRYYQGDPNKIAELEYLVGRVGSAVRAGDAAKMKTTIRLFEKQLSALLPILPDKPKEAFSL